MLVIPCVCAGPGLSPFARFTSIEGVGPLCSSPSRGAHLIACMHRTFDSKGSPCTRHCLSPQRLTHGLMLMIVSLCEDCGLRTTTRSLYQATTSCDCG